MVWLGTRLVLTQTRAAQPSSSEQSTNVGARQAQAARVTMPPNLMARSLIPWKLAHPVDDFRQQEPFERQPATEKTDIRILYTGRAVYFGIHCYDSKPSGIVATELRRDVSQDLDDQRKRQRSGT